jgi:hypothetical protein
MADVEPALERVETAEDAERFGSSVRRQSSWTVGTRSREPKQLSA